MRYTEDYAYLADPGQRIGAWWETGKWIALGGSSALTLGAEVRVRYERYRNNEFGEAAVPDEGYELFRILPYADLRLGSRVRAFTQLNLTQAHRDADSIGPVDDTGADLLQGFAEAAFGSPENRQWTLRAGRQVMAYGSERPRLGLKAAIITGDRNPDDLELQTFNVYFPWGRYFGEAGLIGPSNLIDIHPSLTLDLGSGWSLAAAAIFYWRESLKDGVYGVAGTVLRPAGASRERYIGTQGDVVLGWELSRQLSFEVAYSEFHPGDFIRDTGRSHTVHFIGLEALWRY